MAIRPVVVLPDGVLKQPTILVGRIDDSARELATDLIDTMRSRPACVGLAAPQIGVSRSAFVVDVTGHRKAASCHGQVVMFDPLVVSRGEPVMGREGCLSVPDFTGDVARSATIVVSGLTPDGQVAVIEADAFEARALQHEIDHLDGVLFLDRVASHESVFRRKVYK